MSELVLKGFIGGHTPTLGYFAAADAQEEAFLSALESLVGLNPLVRVRFDIDKDGIFEHVEQQEILSIGNLTRTIEYDTNKPRFGSCSVTLRNSDNRWSDNWPHAFTYFNPTNPVRYHYTKVVVELGFNDMDKWKEDAWFPIFTGYIQAKSESAQDRSVTISMIDEWTFLFKEPLVDSTDTSTFIRTDAQLINDPVTLGTFYGKHSFLPREYNQKDKQIMLLLVGDRYIETIHNYYTGALCFAATNRTYIRGALVSYSVAQYDDQDLYLWGWNSTWTNMGGVKQWLKLNRAHYTILPSASIDFSIDSGASLTFVTAGSLTVTVAFSDFFNYTSTDFEFKAAYSFPYLESNPAGIMFHEISRISAISADSIDASTNNPATWEPVDIDFDHPDYYSFDVTYWYLKNMGCNVCVHYTTGTAVLKSLIEDLCTYARGSFFIDKGRDIINTLPVRRMRFVTHQPRLAGISVKVLTESRAREQEITRDITALINDAVFVSFDWTNLSLYSSDDYISLHRTTDANSIAAYGVQDFVLRNKPGNVNFMYNAPTYAKFLADLYVYMFKEPIQRLTLDTDLIGYTWDLKSLIAIREASNLLTSEIDLTGVFEVYGFRFSTGKFRIGLETQWAGYLIAPDGDNNKRWGFCDDALCDGTAPAETEYYCW